MSGRECQRTSPHGAERVEYNQKINYALHKFSRSDEISSMIVWI